MLRDIALYKFNIHIHIYIRLVQMKFDINNILPLTVDKLSMLKQVRFFWPTLYYSTPSAFCDLGVFFDPQKPRDRHQDHQI